MPGASALCADAFDFSVQLGNFLFQPRDFPGIIGLFAGGFEQLLEALNLVFCGVDLFLLFLIQSHLPGIPLGPARDVAIPGGKRDDTKICQHPRTNYTAFL